MSGSSTRADGSVVASPTAATTALLACGALGLLVALASASIPRRDLLVALSGTLLVAGGLNHLLPTRDDLPPAVAESVFEASAEAVETAMEGSPVYVPTEDGRVRLRPGGGSLERGTEDGVRPTGATIHRLIADDLPEGEPLEATLARIGDHLAGRFGLLVDPAVSVEGSETTVTVAGWALPALDRTDHPAVSVLAVGLAARTGHPVVADVHEDGERGATIELRWVPDADSSSEEAGPDGQFVAGGETEEADPGDDREPEASPPGRDDEA
ncbi:hypothetical protein [Saliphagus sp. LR7]|uniref:hypothetical protein n=1 Tax=Saliphagus sp. LR7 TaxID=2282654 RepID=UPI000DF81227|nr:hypothetical protein [Saliphagus sp. LR7]